MGDIVRLFIFPGLMAFAASSDFFTMTISNRLGLALVAGFVALALFSGMNLHDMLMHAGAAVTVLAISFVMFSSWLDRRRRRQVRCGHRTLARLRPFANLPALCLDLRRHAYDGNYLLTVRAAVDGPGRARLGEAPVPGRRRSALRHRPRGRGSAGLPRYRLDASRLVRLFLLPSAGERIPRCCRKPAWRARAEDCFPLKTWIRDR